MFGEKEEIKSPKLIISKPKVNSIRKERLGSKTAPIESIIDYDLIEYEDESFQDYINSYNYYIYYYSIKPRDPRLPKPLYKPSPDLDFIKGEKEWVNEENEMSQFEANLFAENEITQLLSQMKILNKNVLESPTNNNYNTYGVKEKVNNCQSENKKVNKFINNENIPTHNLNMNDYNAYLSAITSNNINNINNNNLNKNPNFYPKNFTATINTNFNPINTSYYPNQYFTTPNFYSINTSNYAKQNPLQNQTDLNEILSNILDYCKDHSGSRIIQRKFEDGTEEEKNKILENLLPHLYALSKDVFGNYVIQKIFDLSINSNRKSLIMQTLKGHIHELSLHMYGCRVIQKALEVIELEDVISILKEVKNSIRQFIDDQNGNHVVQKLIERLSPEFNKEILKMFDKNVFLLATHQYGCRVIQKIFENVSKNDYKFIIDEIMQNVNKLTVDQYGNYVIQYITEKMGDKFSDLIWEDLKGKVFELSIHKFASNVIEKLLTFGSNRIKKEIIEEIINKDDQFKDKYGNYVVQKLIEVADDNMKENMVKRIITSQSLKKRDGFSKHVINFIEKLGFVYPQSCK